LREYKSGDEKSNVIPDDAFEALARCLYPAIVAYFESDVGQREFADWQIRKSIENLSGIKQVSNVNIKRAG